MYQEIGVALLDRAVSLPARDGETVIEQGDSCDQTLEIRSGIARAVDYSADGYRQILAFFFAGDFIGLPLCSSHRYSVEAVRGLRFVPHASQRLQTGFPVHDSEPEAIAKAIWQEEKAFIARSLILGRVGVQARVAAFLTYLSQRLELADGMLDFSIPQGDMASYLGTSPETVCRTLRRLRDEGVIAVPSRDRLQILNACQLNVLAEGE
nr:helix-turn-helix domain-containing protein [Erythrobacter ani]